MTAYNLRTAFTKHVCLNNDEAIDFTMKWHGYCHAIDDIVDEDINAETKIAAFIRAAEVYNHPFYIKNRDSLRLLIYQITNLYADSVRWEKSEDLQEKNFSDWSRHAGAEMLLAIACLVGGYEHMRSVSQEVRMECWTTHHNENK